MEDMEISRGILEKGQACRNSWGQLKREVKFPGVLKKNSCGISMGLVVFDLVLETSKHEAGESHNNFAEFPIIANGNAMVKDFFSPEFIRVKSQI